MDQDRMLPLAKGPTEWSALVRPGVPWKRSGCNILPAPCIVRLII